MFTKRVWLNLIMLLLVTVLALVAYLEPGIDEPETAPPLLSLSPDDVDRIHLRSGADRQIDLERTDHGWMIVAPIRVAANRYRIDTILGLAQADSHARYPATQAPASFGLDPPRATVRLNDVTIAFGDSEPLHHRRYVQVGDQVHLIDDHFFYAAQLLLPALVDTALLPGDAEPVRLRLPDLVLDRTSGDWRLQPPDKAVSMDRINALVAAWRHARAVRISAYQGETAQATIAVAFADGGHIEMEVLARTPELILGRRDLGLRYHFTAEQADKLLHLPAPAADGRARGADAHAAD
jgi:hypothetical protein